MKYIDLHTHSNYSDGTCPPSVLVSKAIEKGLAAFALTDHDTVAGIEDAVKAVNEQQAPVQFIPGTELSAAYKDKDIHIVGLFINHQNTAFKNAARIIIKRRDDRNMEMVENLRKAGIPISMEALMENNPDTVVTRAHFARFLVDNKITATPADAFRKYLDTDTPYYVPRKYIEPEEAITLIKNAGGVPVLAHPLHYKLREAELEKLVRRLALAGLMGIETLYSNHTRQDEIYAKKLAQKFNLLPSGGSDFHGSNKPAIDIGTGRGSLAVSYHYLEKLAEACNYPL